MTAPNYRAFLYAGRPMLQPDGQSNEAAPPEKITVQGTQIGDVTSPYAQIAKSGAVFTPGYGTLNRKLRNIRA